nr:hypothetical protein [Tanacetum cinerariifolium]
MKSWLVQKQTALGKDKSNSLIVDSLLKTIWSSIHHLLINEVLTIPGQTATGVNTPRSDEDRLELMELTVFLLQTVKKVGIGVNVIDLQVFAVRHMLLLLVQKFSLFSLTNWCYSLVLLGHQVNDITRLQVLVDKKRVVVIEVAIREGMLVAQEIEDEGDADEHVEDVTAGDDAHGDDTVSHGEVPTVNQEPSIPSPTPPTLLPQPP